MSLTVQFNINDSADFDMFSELVIPTPGLVTESVDTQGVAVIEAAATVAFGAFDPGHPYGSQTADFVLQSMQVSSTGSFSTGDVALIGPQPPGAMGSPCRFVFHTLKDTEDLYTGGQIIPTGYKLSFRSTASGPHMVRLTYWQIVRLDQIAPLLVV